MSLPSVSIIGTGSVATHLSRSLELAGFNINEVYGRSISKAKALASQLYVAKPINELDFSESNSSLFFLCVSDAAIAEVASEILLPTNGLLIHCSGATAMAELASDDFSYGVFYPIQTFSKGRKITFENVAICIEASSDEAEEILQVVAKKLKAVPYFMNSEQRLSLHLSAVFACNFTNHFFRISKEILDANGLPFSLLQNLVNETVEKAFHVGPENSQTGPASRNDRTTMAKHERMLGQFPEWKELYELVSLDIRKNK